MCQELCSAPRVKNEGPAFKELCGDGVNRGIKKKEGFTLSITEAGKGSWVHKWISGSFCLRVNRKEL